jgi:hypothetical protein
MTKNEDVLAWSKTRDFIELRFSRPGWVFCTIDDGFCVELKSMLGQFFMRVWPPIQGQMTIEFHAVHQKEYYDWDIYPSNFERHFKNVIDKVLLHYKLR